MTVEKLRPDVGRDRGVIGDRQGISEADRAGGKPARDRSGYYGRSLTTRVGKSELGVPQGGSAGTTIIVKRNIATTLRRPVNPACCQPRACGARKRSATLEGTMLKAATCVMPIASGHALSAGSLDPATTSSTIAPGRPNVSVPMPKAMMAARHALRIQDHHCSDMADPLKA